MILRRALLVVVALFAVGFVLSLLAGEGYDSNPRSITATFPGVAMEPTIQDGQTVQLTESGTFERLDLIGYKPPGEEDKWFVGRVIGLPGDTVAVQDGRILVNNSPLEDVVSVHHSYSMKPVLVPLDGYFVLGDNRNNSYDSHVFGPVPEDRMLGRIEILD